MLAIKIKGIFKNRLTRKIHRKFVNFPKETKNKVIDVLRKIDMRSQNPIFYAWSMEKEEKKLFEKIIKRSKYYLEFGSGGSTICALQKSKAQVYSIESSLDWVDYMSEYAIIDNFSKQKRLNLYHIDIGKTKKWGKPANDHKRHLYPDYSTKIFSMVSTKNVDTVLVDGRFRVACVLSTILNVSQNDKVLILIHDFTTRPYYHDVLKYLNLVERAHTLCTFKIKKDVDINAVKQDYEKFKFIAD